MNPRYNESAKEIRLVARGNFRQLGHDIRDYHIRADDPIAAAGSVVMPVAVGVSKLGNTVLGEFSPEPAVPLGDGAMKYTSRGIRSLARNTLATGKNIITLHPVRALGSAVKAVSDGWDVVAVDPLLDVGCGIFGHQNATRHSLGKMFATAT